jgi:hypothetical protein
LNDIRKEGMFVLKNVAYCASVRYVGGALSHSLLRLSSRASAKYRQLAESAEDAFIKHEFLELAAVCEGVANEIDDRRAGG